MKKQITQNEFKKKFKKDKERIQRISKMKHVVHKI